jgi:hypothetical protein
MIACDLCDDWYHWLVQEICFKENIFVCAIDLGNVLGLLKNHLNRFHGFVLNVIVRILRQHQLKE